MLPHCHRSFHFCWRRLSLCVRSFCSGVATTSSSIAFPSLRIPIMATILGSSSIGQGLGLLVV
jgi:hypothetical protein